MNLKDRPNFILIMTDQQRGDCLSIERHPVLLTPNMDLIGHRGTRFTHAYTPCPSCIAARRCLLSGQEPITNRMVGYRDNEPWDPPATLPQVLRDAGYQTAIVGRPMHQYRPDDFFGFEYVRDFKRDYSKDIAAHQPWGSGGTSGHGISGNGRTARPWHMPEALHSTFWTVTQAEHFLATRDTTRPFFLVVSFTAPHPPLVPPAFYFDRYLRQDLPQPAIGDWARPPANDGLGLPVDSDRTVLKGEMLRSCLAGYYGLINHVDDQIHRILSNKSPLGAGAARTVVAFTADHGEMLGDHYLFRKCYPYEGSARIPLMISAPRGFGLKSEQVCGAVAGLQDVMPTFLDLAELPIPPHVEGRSLLPFLRGEAPPWRAFLHGEHATCYRYEQANHFLTDGAWKYIWYVHDGSEQLFNLKDDPRELRNLAARPEQAQQLALWRGRLIERLINRPEGFSDGSRLIPGVPHNSVPPQ